MMTLINDLLLSGTSGLALSLPKSNFPEAYKAASRLTYYGSLFNSIEINSTFYKLPKAATIQKWGESVPPHFRFTFKLSKSITHSKSLNINKNEVEAFMQIVSYIGAKKGCILIQLPPSVKQDQMENIEDLILQLKAADPKNEWKLAIEFRNRAWYSEATYSFLNQYDTTLVHHDFPSSVTPDIASFSSIVYLRFHGPEGKYRGSYSDEFLGATSNKIKSFLAVGKQVYVYFNNTIGDAEANLKTLNYLIYNKI